MRAKKSLGQHFLTNTGIVALIADAGEVSHADTVLEIGPGKGILTAELLQRGAKVIAVEKDTELIPLLEKKFEKEIQEKQLTIITGDILDFKLQIPNSAPYKLVANIPYYITGAIIRKFLTEKHQPTKMALLVQKEVAERIVATKRENRGKESLLSLSVKAYGQPKYVKTVKAGSFTPPPKVDSAILLINNISREFFSNTAFTRTTLVVYKGSPCSLEERFFEVLHAGFAHKRKQLRGNLKAVFDEKTLGEKMRKCGIAENARAEDLSPENWKCLIPSPITV